MLRNERAIIDGRAVILSFKKTSSCKYSRVTVYIYVGLVEGRARSSLAFELSEEKETVLSNFSTKIDRAVRPRECARHNKNLFLFRIKASFNHNNVGHVHSSPVHRSVDLSLSFLNLLSFWFSYFSFLFVFLVF